MTNQANVDNHRTWQLLPEKPMIKINISESDSNDIIIVRHAAGRRMSFVLLELRIRSIIRTIWV